MVDGFKEKYESTMVGRNGGDALSRVCLIVAIVLVLLSFACIGINPILYVLVLLLGIVAGAYAALRMLSRNVVARQAENAAFLSIFQRFGIGRGGQGGVAEERPVRERPRRAPREDRGYRDEEPAPRPAPAPAQEPQPEPQPAPQPEKVTVTCENCGQHLRVPAGKGTVKVRCPKCQNVFTLHT
jgi:hypothetical protein